MNFLFSVAKFHSVYYTDEYGSEHESALESPVKLIFIFKIQWNSEGKHEAIKRFCFSRFQFLSILGNILFAFHQSSMW